MKQKMKDIHIKKIKIISLVEMMMSIMLIICGFHYEVRRDGGDFNHFMEAKFTLNIKRRIFLNDENELFLEEEMRMLGLDEE